jgi:hypothetical protein
MNLSQNRNTTILGIGAILTVAGGVLTAIFDGDPMTNPDWTSVVAAVITGIGLIVASDAKKNASLGAATGQE